MDGDVHKCIWLVYNLISLELMNETICLFNPTYVPLNQKQLLRQPESLDNTLMSYERILELIEETIRKDQNDEHLAILLSIMIEQLKGKYV